MWLNDAQTIILKGIILLKVFNNLKLLLNTDIISRGVYSMFIFVVDNNI